MPRHQTRTIAPGIRRDKINIAPGIYRERNQLVAVVRLGSSRDGTQQRQAKTFPLGTDLNVMIAWQHGAKQDLITTSAAPAAAGSLAEDIPAYLKTLPDGKYKTESAWVLQHWIASPLGGMARGAIVRLDIVAQIAQWLDAGAAIATVNKRLSRLRKLYHGLDGLDAINPTDRIKFMREPKPQPRDIPVHIIRLILDALPGHGRAERGQTRPDVGVTKIRLRVMAWTGIPPATLRRVRPRDLDFGKGRLYLQPRRKGRGADGAWVALLPEAIDAFRDFAAAGLFGLSYSNSSIGKTWRVGIMRANKQAAAHAQATGDYAWLHELETLPPRCKPYDLRHSFGSEMYRRTGDIRAVSELLQHATLEMTKRYTQGAVSERVAAAIAKAAPAYAQVKKLPAPRLIRLVQKTGQ
jgi:integrase